MDAVELLSIIDVIKNEELYNKKLQVLREAEAKLADSRYIGATIEMIDKIKKAVDKELLEAKKQVEEAKQAKVDQDKAHADRMAKVESDKREYSNSCDRQVAAVKARLAGVSEKETKLTEWDGKLSEWSGRLDNREKNLKQREATLAMRVEKINQIMKEEANG